MRSHPIGLRYGSLALINPSVYNHAKILVNVSDYYDSCNYENSRVKATLTYASYLQDLTLF